MSSHSQPKSEKSGHRKKHDSKSDRGREHEHRKRSRNADEKEYSGEKSARSDHRIGKKHEDSKRAKKMVDGLPNHPERSFDGQARKVKSHRSDDHQRKLGSEKPFDGGDRIRKEKRHRKDDDQRKRGSDEKERKIKSENKEMPEDVKIKTEQNDSWIKAEIGAKEDTSHATVKNDKAAEEIVRNQGEKRKKSADIPADKDEELRLKRIKIREACDVQLIDKRYLAHLAEMHPTSALHELCSKLNWPPPNMSIAFECGPPMMRMYIFKAIVNCQTFQPAVAVDNKKDAKSNAAWFALQEMGFVKKDAANPL